mmetsp:Transcript_99440/g.309820  ORF Transcript_99440/g.309820 Transcript_99440/m.309820 type:complete len:337 (+) Transcript_99440:1160-2170(+)
MISSGSALRTVLALPTSKSLVMAMDLTTVKYCCTKPRNFRLPTPPFSTLRKTSFTCSALTSKPSKDATWEQKASSEMRPSALPASSRKSASSAIPLLSASLRRAVATLPKVARTMDAHLSRTESAEVLQAAALAAALASILCSSFLTSASGPLVAFATFACCSLVHALTAATASSASLRRPSASSSSETGEANASTSAPSRDVSGFTRSASLLTQASTASIFADASPVIAAASLRSRASMWAFFSASSFLMNSPLAVCTFFLRESTPDKCEDTAALHFDSAARASATGAAALPPSFASSPSLVLTKTRACLMLLAPSSIALSMSATKALYGVKGSM